MWGGEEVLSYWGGNEGEFSYKGEVSHSGEGTKGPCKLWGGNEREFTYKKKGHCSEATKGFCLNGEVTKGSLVRRLVIVRRERRGFAIMGS